MPYFRIKNEDILTYNSSTIEEQEKLWPSIEENFKNLASNILSLFLKNYEPLNREELINDAIVFLKTKIYKFREVKMLSKDEFIPAHSYFSTIIKGFLFGKLCNEKEKLKSTNVSL